MPAISVNNIKVVYDQIMLVLKGLSLHVPEGEIVALLGANGAGKSTTLKSISNLIRVERGAVIDGSIEFGGVRVDGLNSGNGRAALFCPSHGRRKYSGRRLHTEGRTKRHQFGP